jgi:NADH:ubiquinone oxidoreductase subunit K
MNELHALFGGILFLLAVGLYGLLAGRHLIKLVIAMQITIKAAVLALVVAGLMSDRLNVAQSLGLTVIVVDTVAAVVALALAVQVKRLTGTLDVGRLARLKH